MARSSLAERAGLNDFAPNDTIQSHGDRTIDEYFQFQLALDRKHLRMLNLLPQSHVLDVAEDATHTLHNLLPFAAL